MPYNPSLDRFQNWTMERKIAPPRRAIAITPSDSADLTEYVRALTCTTAGNVSVVMTAQNDETAVVLAIAPGDWMPAEVRKVNATGTTATGIVGACE